MNKVPFKPFGIYVVVERLPKEEKSEGGIILPEITQETHAKGRVVAVGDGYRAPDGIFCSLTVQVGEIVLYNLHAGTKFNYKGKEYTILLETELWLREI